MTRAELEKVRRSERMRGLAERRWAKNESSGEDIDSDLKGELNQQILARDLLKTMATVKTLQDRLTPPVHGPDSRDARIAELERQVIRMESERQFAALREDLERKIVAVGRSKDDGSSSDELTKVLLTKLVDRAFVDPLDAASKVLDHTAKYSSMVNQKTEIDLKAQELSTRFRIWETDRSDAAQVRIAEAERSRGQMHDLVELGRTALSDALRPVASAIGDGLRQRVAMGAPTAQPLKTPPDYASMSPEQRAEYRSKLEEIQQKINAERARLEQADLQGGREDFVTEGRRALEGKLAAEESS